MACRFITWERKSSLPVWKVFSLWPFQLSFPLIYMNFSLSLIRLLRFNIIFSHNFVVLIQCWFLFTTRPSGLNVDMAIPPIPSSSQLFSGGLSCLLHFVLSLLVSVQHAWRLTGGPQMCEGAYVWCIRCFLYFTAFYYRPCKISTTIFTFIYAWWSVSGISLFWIKWNSTSWWAHA